MTEDKLVPELRFQEFKNEYKITTIENEFNFIKKYSYSRQDEGEGRYYHIHYGDIHSKYTGSINETTQVPSIRNMDKHEEIKYGDIIIADASEDYEDLGKGVVLMDKSNRKFIAGLHTFALRGNDNINSLYFLNYTKTERYKKYTAKIGTGTSVFGITQANFRKLNFPLPSIKEQNKIAGFFSSIDKKIELHEQLIETLEEQKKGLMEKIFNQEVRFKDENGRNYPEWLPVKLGCHIININERVKNKENIPILSSTSKGIYKQTDYFNHIVASQDISNYKIIRKDQFTYRSMSDTGDFTFNLQTIVDIGAVSPAYPVFNLTEEFNNRWFYYYINNSNYIGRQLTKLYQGGTRLALPLSRLELLNIERPSLLEQNKITKLLSLIDCKIDLEKKRLNNYKQYRKGLMQRMFI